MKTTTHLKANCIADAARQLEELPPMFDGLVQFTEQGQSEPWATLDVGRATDHNRSVFPCYSSGAWGDADRRVAHMGVIVLLDTTTNKDKHYRLVVLRASRMAD